MLPGDLTASYDGVCVYVTLTGRISLFGKLILLFINSFIISVIVALWVMNIGIAAICFTVLELLIIRYTLWNVMGKEHVIINTRSLSYQFDYGFFVTELNSVAITKELRVIPFNEVKEANGIYTRLLFESYDENHLPINIYHTTLALSEDDHKKLIELLNQLYLD